MYELFSYWVLLWSLLFIIGIVKYNPIIILFIIYIITSITFIYIYINKSNFYYLLKFIIINILLKFIFIIIILTYYPFIFNINDIYFALILLLLYLILLSSLNKNPIFYYYYLIDIFINGENEINSKFLLPVDIYYDNFYKDLIRL
jgi:hypothetical protein